MKCICARFPLWIHSQSEGLAVIFITLACSQCSSCIYVDKTSSGDTFFNFVSEIVSVHLILKCPTGHESLFTFSANNSRPCFQLVMVDMFVWGLNDAQIGLTCLFSRCLTVMCIKTHTDQRFLSFMYCIAVVLNRTNVLHY